MFVTKARHELEMMVMESRLARLRYEMCREMQDMVATVVRNHRELLKELGYEEKFVPASPQRIQLIKRSRTSKK
jgi:hypothetical protein